MWRCQVIGRYLRLFRNFFFVCTASPRPYAPLRFTLHLLEFGVLVFKYFALFR